MFFSHYWRRREPPVSLRCGEFRSSFLKNVIVLRKEAKMNTLLNLHKETTGLVFHYWRRREPPGSLSWGNVHSAFIAKVKKHKLHTHWQFFIGKNKWFLHFANLHKDSTCSFFSLLATTGAASVPQLRKFSFGFYIKSQKT